MMAGRILWSVLRSCHVRGVITAHAGRKSDWTNWRNLLGAITALSSTTVLYLKDSNNKESVLLNTAKLDKFQLAPDLQTDDTLFHKVQYGGLFGMGMVERMSVDGNSVLSKAQEDVLALWNSIHGGVRHPQMEKPRVTWLQDRLSIRFGFVGSVDVMKFLMEMADALSKQTVLNCTVKDPEIKIRMGENGVTSMLQFDCVRPGSTVSVSVSIPLAFEGHPEVEILKKGELVEEDLSLLEIVVCSMSKSESSKSQAIDRFFDNWVQSQAEDDPFEEFEARIREFMEGWPFGRFPSELEPRQHASESQQLKIKKYPSQDQNQEHPSEELVQKLESMGAMVYRPNPTEKLEWGLLSGYEEQKRRIEDGLLLPLLHPDVSESIAKRTRKHYTSNRPRGILFEGPPGTGKTTSARLIAAQAAVHLIYLPLESILSKWYGESEKLLAEAFKSAEKLGGSIIFFDEIETLGTKRNDDMHEASRRLLSVLLREMDGFDVRKRIIVIGATNRKQDIDAALLSRFDSTIKFDLPDATCRGLIFKQYAQQLQQEELDLLATKTDDMSGRDIRDICESTERTWASKIVRGEVKDGQLPDLGQYLEAVSQRQRTP